METRSFALLSSAGFAIVVCVGCASPSPSVEDESLGMSSQAVTLRKAQMVGLNPAVVRNELGFATAPNPSARHVIRTKSHDCNPIVGTGGAWNGETLGSAIGESHAFCTYAWVPAGKNWPADWTALNAAAETDQIRKSPYIVEDVRASSTPAGAASLGESSFITLVGTGGAGPQASPDTFDLTAVGHGFPGGISGCEVCQEPIGDYLFLVLPPDALAGGPLTLVTETTSYPIGTVTSPIFYVPMPASYTGWSYVSWE